MGHHRVFMSIKPHGKYAGGLTRCTINIWIALDAFRHVSVIHSDMTQKMYGFLGYGNLQRGKAFE